MLNSASTYKSVEPDEQNIACIDAIDLRSLLPIREYLQDHGCTVLENYTTKVDCVYHFVIGNKEYVKSILSLKLKNAFRSVAIIQGSTFKETEEICNTFHIRAVIIPATTLTTEQARVIFGFLFTSKKQILSLIDPTDAIEDTALNTNEEKTEVVFSHQQKTDSSHWEQDAKRIQELMKKTKSKNTDKRKYPPSIFLSLLLKYLTVGMCLWALIHLGSLMLGASLFFVAIRSKNPKVVFSLSSSFFQITRATLVPDKYIHIPYIDVYGSIIDDGISVAEKASVLIGLTEDVDASVFFDQEKNSSPLLKVESLATQWKTLDTELAILEADSKKFSVPFFSSSSKLIKNKIATEIKEARNIGNSLSKAANLYPFIGGFGEEQTFLLLLQNTQELRATGGFIGTVGFLTVKDGVIKELSFEDVYEIDGQLRGHVDPPIPIRTMLGQEHWYLRDSNWNPNFKDSAQQAAWFVEKSIGKSVDGVVAINLSFVQNILNVTGPVTVEGIPEKITSDNLFGILNKEIHEDFFPGSTKKKNTIQSLGNTLVLKLKQQKKQQFSFISLLTKSLSTQDIQLFFDDSKIQEKIASYGWAGEMTMPSHCLASNAACLDDLLAVVESNMGVNKVNYYISRHVKRRIELSNSVLKGTDEIYIKNSSTGDALSGGTYKNYLRSYYPKDTSIDSIFVEKLQLDSQPATLAAIPLPYTESLPIEHNVIPVGVAFTVEPQEEKLIKINYTRPLLGPIQSFDLFIRKQSGITAFPVELEVLGSSSVPKIAAIEEDSGSLVAKPGLFKYNTLIDTSRWVSISF